MTPEAFALWRRQMGISRAEAARRLGVGANQPRQWELGRAKIPIAIDLACATLAMNKGGFSQWASVREHLKSTNEKGAGRKADAH